MSVIVITKFGAKAEDAERILAGEHAATAKSIK